PHVQRYPRGIAETGFLQQDFADSLPDWMSGVRVAKEGGTVEHAVVERPEALQWLDKIRPTVAIPELDDDDVKALHRAMTRVLRTAVRHGRVPGSPRWVTRVRDEPDPRCPRCGTRLERARVGGRATLWCPRCQP